MTERRLPKGWADEDRAMMKLLSNSHCCERCFCVLPIVISVLARMPDLTFNPDVTRFSTISTLVLLHVTQRWNQPYVQFSSTNFVMYVRCCRTALRRACSLHLLKRWVFSTGVPILRQHCPKQIWRSYTYASPPGGSGKVAHLVLEIQLFEYVCDGRFLPWRYEVKDKVTIKGVYEIVNDKLVCLRFPYHQLLLY